MNWRTTGAVLGQAGGGSGLSWGGWQRQMEFLLGRPLAGERSQVKQAALVSPKTQLWNVAPATVP